MKLTTEEVSLVSQINQKKELLIETTRALAHINSGSTNIEGIAQVNDELEDLFLPLSESQCEIPLPPIALVDEAGNVKERDCLPMKVFCTRPEAPVQILCTGHSDTVFPKDCDFKTTWFEGNHLRGPGVADMKGGLVIMAAAIEAINNSPFAEKVGFQVAISPEEEIGSPSSGPVLQQLAQKAHYGLTYEPALEDGTLAGARKGSGNFTLVARGKSVHAGRSFFVGRNALAAVAKVASALADLSDEARGISVNIGKISGGGAVNVVPDLAICRFNIRVPDKNAQRQIESDMQRAIDSVEIETGCALSLSGNFNRPPKPVTEKQAAFFQVLKNCGHQLGIPVEFKATGGCCEGNNLAAAGLVNIDTLGVRGGAIHSDQEFACLDSFVERAQLSALLMAKLSQRPF